MVQQHQRDADRRTAANSIYGAGRHSRGCSTTCRPSIAFRDVGGDRGARRRFADLGQKYNFSDPAGEPAICSRTPARCRTTRSSRPGPRTRLATRRCTRRCSTTAPAAPTRCRSATAGSRRSATSASTTRTPTPLVGGNENPYPAGYPSKPTLSGMFGQDSNSDNFANLNFWASGTAHGPGCIRRAVGRAAARHRDDRHVVLLRHRLPCGRRRGGMPDRPIAYFQQRRGRRPPRGR